MLSTLPYRLVRAQRSVTLPHGHSGFVPVGSLIVTASSTRHHQRRLSSSSSKPSSPAEDGSQISQRPSKAALQETDGEKPSSGRRKARHGAFSPKIVDERFARLPSVPSTQHVHPEQMAISAFFSLHRPMSVTASVPISHEASTFAEIFNTRRKASYKSAEVISTLASVVSGLEQHTSGKGPEVQDAVPAAPDQFEEDSNEPLFLSNDSPLQFPNHLLSGRYRPFNTPPPPEPLNEGQTRKSPSKASSRNVRRKTYSAVFTVFESTNASGDKTYVASNSPIIAEEVEDAPVSPGMLDRVRVQQEQWENYRSQVQEPIQGRYQRMREMYALSVKRQRKLKMKKQKMKKLLRKTRTLRRKLDKA